MTLFNADPYGIDDLDTLRGMVDLLQKMNHNLQQIQTIQQGMYQTLYQANNQQGTRIETLYERIELLTQRTELLLQGTVNNRPEQPLRQN